ncbi:MAG: HIT domain-containing protein [Bryobacteraceae bacterium]
MDHLWSPWRFRYATTAAADRECIFCVKAAEADDHKNFIIHRGEHNFVLLNIYPYSTGHLMVTPYRHVATLADLDAPTLTELAGITRLAEMKLRQVYNAPGYNMGLNIGQSAGAGIAGHLHMHVLPRWPGDVNFMTSVAETRVLPEDLAVTAEKLIAAFQE